MCEGAAGAGLSVVARDREGRIVGFRVAEPWPAPPAEGFEWPAAMTPIASLLASLEAQFDRLHAADNRAVHFIVMGLLPDYESLGLASLMVRDCLRLATQQGFPRVFAEATHEGSARIFRSHGFHTVAQIPYATFEHEGRRVFSSVPATACLLVEKELTPSGARVST
jgi:GNAT superfamily N-acetyltransferase